MDQERFEGASVDAIMTNDPKKNSEAIQLKLNSKGKHKFIIFILYLFDLTFLHEKNS